MNPLSGDSQQAVFPFSHPLSGQPFGTALELCILLIVFCWVAPLFARGHGWLDRLWSLCPPAYCLLVAAGTGFDSARINLMTVLVLVWSVRLTYNFARKGGYRKGDEDYRWASMQEHIGSPWFQLLNVAFNIPSQLLLMWLFTSPVHQAWLGRETPLGWLDGLAAALFAAFFVVELIGDEQMWAFQQDKKRRIAAGEDVAQPFINTGLFRYSRHPSHLAEMVMWFAFYLFAVSASGTWLHWTGLGFILLIVQFFGAIRLTESISAGRYPTYAEYQAKTPMLVPLPRR